MQCCYSSMDKENFYTVPSKLSPESSSSSGTTSTKPSPSRSPFKEINNVTDLSSELPLFLENDGYFGKPVLFEKSSEKKKSKSPRRRTEIYIPSTHFKGRSLMDVFQDFQVFSSDVEHESKTSKSLSFEALDNDFDDNFLLEINRYDAQTKFHQSTTNFIHDANKTGDTQAKNIVDSKYSDLISSPEHDSSFKICTSRSVKKLSEIPNFHDEGDIFLEKLNSSPNHSMLDDLQVNNIYSDDDKLDWIDYLISTDFTQDKLSPIDSLNDSASVGDINSLTSITTLDSVWSVNKADTIDENIPCLDESKETYSNPPGKTTHVHQEILEIINTIKSLNLSSTESTPTKQNNSLQYDKSSLNLSSCITYEKQFETQVISSNSNIYLGDLDLESLGCNWLTDHNYCKYEENNQSTHISLIVTNEFGIVVEREEFNIDWKSQLSSDHEPFQLIYPDGIDNLKHSSTYLNYAEDEINCLKVSDYEGSSYCTFQDTSLLSDNIITNWCSSTSEENSSVELSDLSRFNEIVCENTSNAKEVHNIHNFSYCKLIDILPKQEIWSSNIENKKEMSPFFDNPRADLHQDELLINFNDFLNSEDFSEVKLTSNCHNINKIDDEKIVNSDNEFHHYSDNKFESSIENVPNQMSIMCFDEATNVESCQNFESESRGLVLNLIDSLLQDEENVSMIQTQNPDNKSDLENQSLNSNYKSCSNIQTSLAENIMCLETKKDSAVDIIQRFKEIHNIKRYFPLVEFSNKETPSYLFYPNSCSNCSPCPKNVHEVGSSNVCAVNNSNEKVMVSPNTDSPGIAEFCILEAKMSLENETTNFSNNLSLSSSSNFNSLEWIEHSSCKSPDSSNTIEWITQTPTKVSISLENDNYFAGHTPQLINSSYLSPLAYISPDQFKKEAEKVIQLANDQKQSLITARKERLEEIKDIKKKLQKRLVFDFSEDISEKTQNKTSVLQKEKDFQMFKAAKKKLQKYIQEKEQNTPPPSPKSPISSFSGCNGLDALTLNEEQWNIVTWVHTVRNSQPKMLGLLIDTTDTSPLRVRSQSKLTWSDQLVSESSLKFLPSKNAKIIKPILVNKFQKYSDLGYK